MRRRRLKMNPAESTAAAVGDAEDETRHRGRDWLELGVGYGLILLTIWTPRPAQRWLLWAAAAWVALTTWRSFPGWEALGFRRAGLGRSLWVAGAALLLTGAATGFAARLHTLHEPSGLSQWVRTFAGYAIWAFVQQFLLQGYFLLRLLRLMRNPAGAAVAAAGIFAAAHLPNPILTPLTLLWGLGACFLFLRYQNLYPLAVAHAAFGICVAITIPGPVVHNMRVGLGYLRYRAPQTLHLSQRDQTVSTEAWVMAEAPTRRWARQARP
jgi:membrane protease YdiL (CAAX protease family)